MKEVLKNSASFNRIEFWAVTTLFVFVLFFFISNGMEDVSRLTSPNRALFEQARVPYSFYRNYFVPQLLRDSFLFLAFLLLNFSVIPQLIRKGALFKNIALVLTLLVVAGMLLGITDTYLKEYLFTKPSTQQETYNGLFRRSFLYAFWLLFMLGLYTVIKYAGVYLLANADAIHRKYPFMTPNGLAAVVFWMIGLFLLLIGNGHNKDIIALWVIIVPSGILLYWTSLYAFIPRSLGKKRAFLIYLAKIVLLLLLTYLPISLLALLLTKHENGAFIIASLNVAFQGLITAPLSWVLFERQRNGKEEVYLLKKELGQSHASFDFLRSQINPHFLFNVLNTIYGTAIQEKAERTSESLEMLGDMMRFMLQENMLEKIPLVREIQYLNNYIGLQRLRTDPTPSIQIQTHIGNPVGAAQIAPMLLIPFVENAFKHGISLREPSHIVVSLEMRDHTLHFDVHNSKHARPDNDPEKHRSGIGLSNVKQRLQLFYPAQHELMIRETGKEFFVHLTMQLQ